MRVLIAGSSGLIGTALFSHLCQKGYEVVRLVRSGEGARWDPESGTLDAGVLDGVDAVVNLCGETIGERWDEEKKKRLISSRVTPTKVLVEALMKMERPATFISASATGYYGDRADEVLTEPSFSGNCFLSALCRDWETAAQPASFKRHRVVNLRTGIVLSGQGGALAKMLTPFKMGIGGRIGTGNQWMSWIDIKDIVRIVEFILLDERISGPVNAVAPESVMNREFTKTLGLVLRRPTIFPMPEFAIRLAFGEMGKELLLASTRVLPAKLASFHFDWMFADLEESLRHVLSLPPRW